MNFEDQVWLKFQDRKGGMVKPKGISGEMYNYIFDYFFYLEKMRYHCETFISFAIKDSCDIAHSIYYFYDRKDIHYDKINHYRSMITDYIRKFFNLIGERNEI